MPLPVPQPVDVGEPSLYMPIDQAKLKELTQEHQPSLIASSISTDRELRRLQAK